MENEPKKVLTSFAVCPIILKKLKINCLENDKTMAGVVNKLIKDYLDLQKK